MKVDTFWVSNNTQVSEARVVFFSKNQVTSVWSHSAQWYRDAENKQTTHKAQPRGTADELWGEVNHTEPDSYITRNIHCH